ncbi:MAG: PDZ domain-containing protein, partial [bacterium]
LFFLVATLPLLFNNCGGNGPRSVSSTRDHDGWIGVYVQDLDDELRHYLDIDERRGVLVNDVIEDSPADKAGLKKEDVIIRFNGKRIRNSRDLARAIDRVKPRSRVKVEIVRNNDHRTVRLRIGEKPRTVISRNRFRNRAPRFFSFRGGRPWLGVELADLNRDLAPYFKTKEHRGVLILSIVEDSPADKADLKAGDVILKVAGDRITRASALTKILTDYDSGDEIELDIRRDGKNKTVKVELEESDWDGHFEFDRESFEDWQHDMQSWKDDIEELKHELRNRHRDFERKQIDDLRSKIRHNIERNILDNIEIQIPEIDIELLRRSIVL